MYPSVEEANKILEKGRLSNPGDWVEHCKVVATLASTIATACNMDSDKAYVLGLMHDIGRSRGHTAMAHMYDGYHYMKSLGYELVAKVCISHTYTRKDRSEYLGKCDITNAEYEEFIGIMESLEYDEYDMLIQLCDMVCTTEYIGYQKRIEDVERRYKEVSIETKNQYQMIIQHFELLAHKTIDELAKEAN